MATKQTRTPNRSARPVRRRKTPDNRPSKSPDMQIQYTPAKAFNRNRFLLYLATVAAVVLAVVLGMSIFFKIGQVNVSGAEKYTPWEIKEASGIQDGDPLLSISEAKITARIRTKLPYVGDVRIGIKLPDMVNIEITELQVVYAIEDVRSDWWLLDATGKVVDTTDSAAAKNHTRILGVRIQVPEIGTQSVAADVKVETQATTETDVPVATMPQIPGSQLLDAAVQVLSALEENGVMGVVDNVDVSDPENLILWYGDRYQVSLGDVSRLPYKIASMKAAIEKMGDYQTGLLDVSFTIWPNEVGYRPFDGENATKK